MAWLAVDRSGQEIIGDIRPLRDSMIWDFKSYHYILLPNGTIKKLIGRDLTWEDDPVEI